MSANKRVVVYVPQGLLEELDGVAVKEHLNRSEAIREALEMYVTEQRKEDIRTSLQQGYVEMARLNLRIASEAFPLEEEAGGTVERLVSGV